MLVVYKNNSSASNGDIACDTFSISGNTLTNISYNKLLITHNQYFKYFKLRYDVTHDRFWLSYQLDYSSGNYRGYYISIVPDYSSSGSHTISAHANYYYDHSSSGHDYHNFDINTGVDDRLVSCYRDKANNYVYVSSSTIDSNGALTTTNPVNLQLSTANWLGWTGVAYSPDADKWLAVYGANANIKGRVLTITGSGASTSISAGTEASLVSYGTWTNIVYDTTINAFAISYGDGSGHPHLTYATISGTTVSAGNDIQLSDASLQGSEDRQANNISFDSYRGRVYVGFPKSGKIQYVTVAGGTATTTLSNGFIGYSSAAINDTATGTIGVTGNTNSSLSGLTAGSKYYVQKDGSLGTTADDTTSVEAGIALSSTKLLIKG